MHPWTFAFRGRTEEHVVSSAALRDNPLGDPSQRPLWVTLPPGYDDEPDRRYPTIWIVQGLLGQLDMWRNRKPFQPTYPERADELIAGGEMPPVILVWVDAWTSLGGSQFLDSPATGRYHTYLCDELVPWVDARYRTLAAPAHRGIAGHSSGGYGALVTPMLRPDLFGGLAAHAPDCLFEVSLLPDFREAARTLRDSYGGSYAAFWDDFRSRPPLSRGSDFTLLNVWCMAACYSADADGTVRLPFDPATGELIPGVWARWLDWDPVRMVPRYADALRGLRAISLDAGTSDEVYLDLGAEALRQALDQIGISDFRFELFPGRHGGIDHRFPLGLRYLAERLAP